MNPRPRITRIGDIFPADSKVAVWLVSLMCGRNDLVEASRLVQESPRSATPRTPEDNGRLVYRLRLSLSHFHEHYHLLRQPPKEAKSLMDANMMVGSAQDQALSHAEYWKLKIEDPTAAPDPQLRNESLLKVLKDIRDVTFHYREETRTDADISSTRIKSGLKQVEDDRVPIFSGTDPFNMRWLIADEVRMQYFKTKGLVTVAPLDIHLEKIPLAEVGLLTDSLIWTYLAPYSPTEQASQ